jgi:multiple sugar transport system substrate-binding protein
MNALRPFKNEEVAALGGAGAFLPATWQRGVVTGDTMWAIPWLAETRVIVYRRALLQAAGIDEKTAFSTPERLEKTLEMLQESGVSMPWIVPTTPTLNTFHNLTSWIWGAGGDFVDDQQRRVTFADPQARAGIRDYYRLYRFIAPEFYQLNANQVDGRFADGEAAMTINGPWAVFPSGEAVGDDPPAGIHVALPPGVPCVLASHLVVWKHVPVRQERVAIELVRFLTDQQAQLTCSRQVGLLPARLETLAGPPFASDPMYQVFVNGLKSGRSFPAMRLWGLMEEQLTAAFGNLWASVLEAEEPELDALIRRELEPLAQRLNRILQ